MVKEYEMYRNYERAPNKTKAERIHPLGAIEGTSLWHERLRSQSEPHLANLQTCSSIQQDKSLTTRERGKSEQLFVGKIRAGYIRGWDIDKEMEGERYAPLTKGRRCDKVNERNLLGDITVAVSYESNASSSTQSYSIRNKCDSKKEIKREESPFQEVNQPRDSNILRYQL